MPKTLGEAKGRPGGPGDSEEFRGKPTLLLSTIQGPLGLSNGSPWAPLQSTIMMLSTCCSLCLEMACRSLFFVRSLFVFCSGRFRFLFRAVFYSFPSSVLLSVKLFFFRIVLCSVSSFIQCLSLFYCLFRFLFGAVLRSFSVTEKRNQDKDNK